MTTSPVTSVTAELTALYAGLQPSVISPATMHAAKRVLLDAAGVMIGASGFSPDVQGFVRLAVAMGEGPCQILGTTHRVSPSMAALANGSMAHALDYEDSYDLTPGHPNASLVPALIALSQLRGGVSGPRFLAALIAGCDLGCRLGLALEQRMEVGGWYPPPILAGFGATLGSAHLLGLSPQQMADALSLALCQITMPGEIKYSERTVIRAIREAFPAQTAVQSALLAEQGLAGFEQPLEGKSGLYALYAAGKFSPDVLLAPFDDGFYIEELTFKAWPSCRGTHPFIQMALALKQEHGFTPDDVSAIRVGIGPVQRMLVEPLARKQAPAVAIDAKFSVPFCTATAIVAGAVGLDSFGEAQLRDPAILSLASRIDFEQAEGSESWRGDAGAIHIELRDGRCLSASLELARGTPDAPLSDDDLRAKFRDCAARAAVPLSASQADELAARILSLESCEDVGALFRF